MKLSQKDSSSTTTSSSDMGHFQKYSGLIKRSQFKIFRDYLFRYFDYLNTMAPSNKQIASIFRVVLFYQFCIMSFFPYTFSLWPTDSLFGQVFVVFTTVSFLCPCSVSSNTHFLVTLLIYIFLIAFLAFFFIIFFIFLKVSKLNSKIVNFLSISFNILQPFFINMISSNIARSFFYIIENDNRSSHIITFVFGFVILFFLYLIQTLFISSSLTFRPQLIQVMYSRYCFILYGCYISIFFFSTIGGLYNKTNEYHGIAGLVLSLINVIPGGVLIYLSFIRSIWVHIQTMYVSQSFSITFVIFSIILPTLGFFEVQQPEVIVIIYSLLISIFIFIFKRNEIFQEKKNIDMLDDIENEKDINIADISYHKLLDLLRFGFDNGHKLCHSWELFHKAIEKYPNNYTISLMYIRYAAIYSDEADALQVASRFLRNIKHNSIDVKYLLYQVNSIVQNREVGLSKLLKKTLTKIGEKTDKCRNQMKNAWECVMRGNISDLETISIRLKRNQDEILREFYQLCLVYPNNPYVFSAYSAFLLDILCKEKQANEVKNIYRMLRSGTKAQVERSYYFAMNYILTLPTEEQHKAITDQETISLDTNQSVKSSFVSIAALGAIADFNDLQSEEKIQKRYLESMVNSVKLPTSRYGPILILLSMSLLFPIVVIVELVLVTMKMKENKESINIMKYISFVNLYASNVVYYSFQYIMSVNGYTSTLKEKFYSVYNQSLDQYNKVFPNYYIDDDRIALLKSTEDLENALNEINTRISKLAMSGLFQNPLNYLFNDQFIYRHYMDSISYTEINTSLENVITYTAATAIQVANFLNPTRIYEAPGVWSLIKNGPLVFTQCELFGRSMSYSMQNLVMQNNKYIRTIVLSVQIPVFLISLALLITLGVEVEREKNIIYGAFKSLPKSVSSSIISHLDAQSGKAAAEGTTTNNNKSEQEENALKILSNILEEKTESIGRFIILFLLVLIFTLSCIAIIIIMVLLPANENEKLISLTPIYHNTLVIHTRTMTSLVSMLRNGILYDHTLSNDGKENFPFNDYPDDYSFNLQFSTNNLHDLMNDMHILRYGERLMNSSGIIDVDQHLIELLSTTTGTGEDMIPTLKIQILDKLCYDSAVSYVRKTLYSMVSEMTINSYINGLTNFSVFSLDDPSYQLISVWLFGRSYHDFVLPAVDILDQYISNFHYSEINSKLLASTISLIVIIILCGIIMIPLLLYNNETAQWSLRLLLLCDPAVVFQSKAILKILSNNFSNAHIDDKENKSSFYEIAVANSLDGVIFMTNDLIIRKANNAVLNIIGKPPEEIIGQSIKDVFQPSPENEASLRQFYQAIDGAMNCLRSPSIDTEIYICNEKGNTEILDISLIAISLKGEIQLKPINYEGISLLVLSMKDITSNVLSRNILQEENKKNESLLSMIFPPNVIAQLKNGNDDTSFPVSYATILFLDIIDFHDLCNSHQAIDIMKILNRFFSELGIILRSYSRLSKIKTMGDCYMIAGGVFDEINQPDEHAKQAICFGLDAIQMISKLNSELNETLALRIGCNNGGPIAAGVLGKDRPVFDLIGPTIDIAFILKNHSTPNSILIPQHVYELIFGNQFVIREYREIDIRGKTYNTFIVSDYGYTKT